MQGRPMKNENCMVRVFVCPIEEGPRALDLCSPVALDSLVKATVEKRDEGYRSRPSMFSYQSRHAFFFFFQKPLSLSLSSTSIPVAIRLPDCPYLYLYLYLSPPPPPAVLDMPFIFLYKRSRSLDV